MDLTITSALGLSQALERRDVSSVEVMQATLARIGEVNDDVNAIVSLRSESDLMALAREADATSRMGWLHGIPIAIKDLANVKGLPTSKGSPLFAEYIAPRDDVIVARLRAAGAIVIGKTNTPEFGLGSHTFNSVHGTTRNPYDTQRSCGGSSGGAAVALATGMLCIADGSDMMGSLRNPAGWNNVYGMRPSWGVVPNQPEGDAYFEQMSTLGPMARDPSDLAALLDTMSGLLDVAPNGLKIDATLPQIDALPEPPRVAWLGDWGGAFPTEPSVLTACDVALAQMSNMGWRVDVPKPLYDANAMWTAWIDLRSASVAASKQVEYDDLSKRELLKSAMIWEIERGRAMDAMQLYRASTIRSDWFRSAVQAFEIYDVLALPSAQTWPFSVDWEHPVEIAGTIMDTYHRWMQVVVPASLIGLPVVNVPIGFGENGLPMGIQLIGRRGADAHVLQIAQAWHTATRWPQSRPAFAKAKET